MEEVAVGEEEEDSLYNEDWDVTQWKKLCLTWVRFWVQSPITSKRKYLYNEPQEVAERYLRM